jgi:hypothetical protein
MSAKKTSTTPKAKKSKAAKEAKPEDGKPAEAKGQEVKPEEAKGKEAKASAKPPKAKKAKDEAKPKKLSAIDAAAKVLSEKGEPMNCQDMINAMAAKGYWTSPGGKTPAATLYSAILRELQTKREERDGLRLCYAVSGLEKNSVGGRTGHSAELRAVPAIVFPRWRVGFVSDFPHQGCALAGDQACAALRAAANPVTRPYLSLTPLPCAINAWPLATPGNFEVPRHAETARPAEAEGELVSCPR